MYCTYRHSGRGRGESSKQISRYVNCERNADGQSAICGRIDMFSLYFRIDHLTTSEKIRAIRWRTIAHTNDVFTVLPNFSVAESAFKIICIFTEIDVLRFIYFLSEMLLRSKYSYSILETLLFALCKDNGVFFLVCIRKSTLALFFDLSYTCCIYNVSGYLRSKNILFILQ